MPALQTTLPATPYRLTGIVRLDGTGKPVAGAMLRIHVGDVFDSLGPDQTLVESNADGAFAVDLPAGPFQVSFAKPPVGFYWVGSRPGSMGSLSVGPDKPMIHGEFRVQRGTLWNFQFARGPERKPCTAFISGSSDGSPETLRGSNR